MWTLNEINRKTTNYTVLEGVYVLLTKSQTPRPVFHRLEETSTSYMLS